MQCVVQLNVSKPIDIEARGRCEYLVKFSDGNHFVSVNVARTWPDKGIILGEARVLVDNLVAPLMGEVLGLNESDIRGWLLLVPDLDESSVSAS